MWKLARRSASSKDSRTHRAETERVRLCERLRGFDERVLGILAHGKGRWSRQFPELVRVWGEVHETAGAILGILGNSQQPGSTEGLEARLQAVFELDLTQPSVEVGWAALDSLRGSFIEIGDAPRLHAMLQGEATLAKEDRADQVARGVTSWKHVFPEEELTRLLKTAPGSSPDEGKGPTPGEWATQVRSALQILHRERVRGELLWRQRQQTSSRYFLWTLLLSVPLVAVFAILVTLVGESTTWRETSLAVAAGALGSAVSGAFKLRELTEITRMRFYGRGLGVQLTVGAAAGLFVLLLVQGSVLALPGAASENTEAASAIYAFAAGFSEPFFLGVVGKIASTGSKQSTA